MPISLSPEQMRSIILDHYTNPAHRSRPENLDGYLTIHSNSINCIDDIDVYLKVENDKVIDCCFEGVACAISTASTDIMCDLVIDKSEEEAKQIIDQYLNMIFEKEYDEDILDEAIAFKHTHKQAARIKCATIGWNGLEDLFKKYDEEKNGK